MSEIIIKMKVIYRTSDGSNKSKKKLDFVSMRNMFIHFLKVFEGYDIIVFADNVSEDTYKFLCDNYDKNKIIRTTLNNAKSFLYALDYVIKNFDKDTKVYFSEDDYIYQRNAPNIIEEGLSLAEYVTGYDHPDKYLNHKDGGPNPYIANGGETTIVLTSKSSHWKLTNSTTMTFASSVKILQDDFNIFYKYCFLYKIPNDFQIFCELIQQKNRKLVSSIPGVCTHGEIEYLSKFVDWIFVYYTN